MHYLPGSAEARRLTTDELRHGFLVRDLFQPGALRLRVIDLDRVVLGGAVPISHPLRLDAPPELAADYFTERRELGVLCIDGAGSVAVDGQEFALAAHDVLYIGRGCRDVAIRSDDAAKPASFFLVSYPAHASYPTALVRAQDADVLELGSTEGANMRRVRRYIHAGGARSAQLVMGVTVLARGSVWNTMPTHTHVRRSEVYLYFDLPADAFVAHFMGEPTEVRALMVRNAEAALSPGWSVHAGCGTRAYAFCWAMGGENQDYSDMQTISMETLR